MEFLRFLEGIRTPIGDAFFSTVTHLGEETIFILVGLLFFWCINKKQGYFILSVGFLGTIINQFLKLTFRIPRPWVRDPEFTIVESARAEATGYSFPSGHTQSAIGVFGSIARITSHKLLRTLCILACVLVPLSRMYLGVHTPADVIVSTIVALLLIFILYPVINKIADSPKGMRLFLLTMTLLSGAFLIYVSVFPFPADIDPHNMESGLKNAYTLLGAIAGMIVVYIVDERWLHFSTEAVWWVQMIKVIFGLGIVLAAKSGLKAPIEALLGNLIGRAVRYFLVVVVAGAVWPLSFRWLSRLGQKK